MPGAVEEIVRGAPSLWSVFGLALALAVAVLTVGAVARARRPAGGEAQRSGQPVERARQARAAATIGTVFMVAGLALIGLAGAASIGLVPADALPVGRVIVPAPAGLTRAAFVEGDRELALALDPPGGLAVDADGRFVARVSYVGWAASRVPEFARPEVDRASVVARADQPAAGARTGALREPSVPPLARPELAPPPPPTGAYLTLPVPADRDDRAEQSRPKPGRPVRLLIPSIKVDTQVVNAGIVRNAKGELEWETVPFVAAHYGDYTAPVGAVGNAVISGHVVTLNMGNVFRNLYQVEIGDRVQARTADAEFEYEVVNTELVSPTRVDVMDPTPDATLTLITCGGEFDPRTRTFDKRLVVRAKLVGSRFLSAEERGQGG